MLTIDPARLASMISEELPALVKIRHELHENPGIQYQEHYATQVLQRELDGAAVKYKAGLAGGTGVVGHLPGKADVAIGLRADMDALPIMEQTGLPYASKDPGLMHACGHDGHTTILIGAARVLARIASETQLPRPVTFVFQPAEEGGAGGKRMIEDGCLDGSLFAPAISQMFGLHGWPDLPLGQIATCVGPITAATYVFRAKVTGKGGHAAFPHFTRDPIVASAAIITAAQTIVSRNVDPLGSAVVSVTRCIGGTAFNVIPEDVILEGTIRALDLQVEKLVTTRFQCMVEQIAAAHDCTVEFEYIPPNYPVTVNSAEAVEVLRQVVPDVRTDMTPVMGGEDFAYYSHVVPSGFFVLGLRPGDERIPGLHHPKFNFNDDAIATGVEAFCRLALRN